jgi:hypothetical protein
MKLRIASVSVAIVSSLVISQVALGQNQPSTTPPIMDRAAAEMYDLPFCSTPEQLDCVASVEVKPPSGEYFGVTTDRQQVWTLEVDSLGNRNYAGSLYWILPGAGGATEYFAVSAQLFTPAHTRIRGVLSVSVDGLPVGYMAKVSVRTSWLRPQNLQFRATSANYSHSIIPGGNLWTFTGAHTKVSNYTSEEGYASNWNNKADIEETLLRFVIHHAGVAPERSTWDPRCADSGFTAQAFNAPGAGSPEWDSRTQSLQFNIGAPHLDSQGDKNIGFFRLWVSEAFASCQWPDNKIVGAESLEARIFNEDGSLQDADVTVTNDNGMIFLDAKNFHYSAPIFQISALGTAVIPPTAIARPSGSSNTKQSPSASSGKSPSPSASTNSSSEPSEIKSTQLATSESNEVTPESGILIGVGSLVLIGTGLGVTVYIRHKQGKPLFPIKRKPRVFIEAKPAKKGKNTKP